MRYRGHKRVIIDDRATTGVFNAPNERGIALIVTLVMLVMIGLLGAFALNTSTTELHIAGNYRNQQFAYYNADAIEGWGPNNSTVRNNITPYTTNTYNGPAMNTGTGTTQVTVQFLCVGPPPPSMGADSDIFSALHYLVTITGKGPNGQSEFTVETEMIQLGPKSDPDC